MVKVILKEKMYSIKLMFQHLMVTSIDEILNHLSLKSHHTVMVHLYTVSPLPYFNSIEKDPQHYKVIDAENT